MTWPPIPRTPLLAAALTCVPHAWRVFPVAGKVPVCTCGFHDASTDAAAVQQTLREAA